MAALLPEMTPPATLSMVVELDNRTPVPCERIVPVLVSVPKLEKADGGPRDRAAVAHRLILARRIGPMPPVEVIVPLLAKVPAVSGPKPRCPRR
jgi:hypothetical protein